jgi:tetratricopeptide (TPR) repeat protein
MKRTLIAHMLGAFIAMSAMLIAPLYAQAGHGRGRLSGQVVDPQGKPIANAVVRLEFQGGGLKDQTTTDSNGAFGFIGLGTGGANIFASAEGYLDAQTQVQIQQLNRNQPVKLVLAVDIEKKARVKNEATLELLEQGNKLFADGKFAEALQVFQQFTADNPEVYQIHFNIGNCFREINEPDKAAEQYKLALDGAKAKADTLLQAKAFASLGELSLRREKMNEAQEYFKQSIALNPQDEILAYNVAEICFGNGKTDEALQYYQLATQIKPDWGEPHMKLGYAWLNKGDIAKAVASFETFLRLDPQSSQAAAIQALLDSLKKTK